MVRCSAVPWSMDVYAPAYKIDGRHVEDPACPVAGGVVKRHCLKFTHYRGFLPQAEKAYFKAMYSILRIDPYFVCCQMMPGNFHVQISGTQA